MRWAILEEKRRIVRMLINKVLVLKDIDKGKQIIPQLTFELPSDFASLVYGYQSPAYIEQAREMVQK